jgi:multidrug resistance efflux pump
MRAKCRDEVEKNASVANGGPGKTEKEGQAYRDKLDQKAAKAKKEAEASPRSKQKQRAAQNAAAKATRAQNAHCLAKQGRKLRRDGIDGPFDGQVPTNASQEGTGVGDGGLS